ncbi:helix-turn-helix transcriptional regulator [Nonomuraea sp. NPDC048826]|uniref:helix-turn-helix transcriptional regulator n=1 Tax=Nonomuraea sp. NPDC048826 TaxID=3364347 RepID=UPI00371670B4
MPDTTARALALLNLLQTHRHWTGPELAERLGVTQRTVRRDVERLRDLGYRIDSVPGPAGGYRLEPGGAVPPLLLTDEEAVAMAAGLRLAATRQLTDGADTTIRALAKLERVLPAALRERVNAVAAAVRPAGTGPGPGVSPGVLTELALACRGHERVRFTHVSGSRSGSGPGSGSGSRSGSESESRPGSGSGSGSGSGPGSRSKPRPESGSGSGSGSGPGSRSKPRPESGSGSGSGSRSKPRPESGSGSGSGAGARPESGPSSRWVEPHRLAPSERHWYLICWDLDRDGWRTFRVDRIAGVRRTGVFFEPRPLSPRQVVEFLAVAASWSKRAADATATIRMPVERLRRLFGEWAQGAEAVDAGTTVWPVGGADVRETMYALSWIPEGVAYTVDLPDPARAELRAALGRMLRALEAPPRRAGRDLTSPDGPDET